MHCRGWFTVILLVLLGAGGGVAGTSSWSAADVVELFEAELLAELNGRGDYIAFLYPHPLEASDMLAPYAPTPIPDSVDRLPHLVPYDLTGPTWFLWIDRAPHARYAHETWYVLIDASDGTHTVHQEMWWPVLNGRSLWVESDDYWSAGNWLSSSLSAGTPSGAPASGCEAKAPRSDPFDWALVVNGWAPGQPGQAGFEADARGMCAALGDLGMRVSLLEPGAASPEALEAHVVRLFTEIPLYNCCDRLYFYIACHASPGALWIGGQRLSDTKLARMLTTPGNTYVPSRVYVLLESGYGASFIPALAEHSSIQRVWTASHADQSAWDDVDPPCDPNPSDSGGEWTSSILAVMARLLNEHPLATQARDFGREYVPLNLALANASDDNAAAQLAWSLPADYLFSEGRDDYVRAAVEYLAGYDRAYRLGRGTLEETITKHGAAPCLELLWILHYTARHDPIPAPTPAFSYRVVKGYARDLAHSNWWEYCDLFWKVFSAEISGE